MENLITVNNNHDSLDSLYNALKTASSFECSKEYDIWEHRLDVNGQMAQCLVVKKSGMHALKAFFINENTVKINYIIPNKVMHAYFGKSAKARQNIIEIIAGVVKQTVLAGPQKKAFEELQDVFKKAAV